MPLASALVKSLTELDLRWAFLAVQMPSWFFFLVNAAQRQLKFPTTVPPSNGNWDKTHRMDFNGNGVGQYDLHLHLHCTATGPGDGHCMHVF